MIDNEEVIILPTKASVAAAAADDGIVRTGQRAKQTHCKRGHAFTADNLYKSKTNRRLCRQCMLMHQRKRQGVKETRV